jgi:hypothetical protein
MQPAQAGSDDEDEDAEPVVVEDLGPEADE